MKGAAKCVAVALALFAAGWVLGAMARPGLPKKTAEGRFAPRVAPAPPNRLKVEIPGPLDRVFEIMDAPGFTLSPGEAEELDDLLHGLDEAELAGFCRHLARVKFSAQPGRMGRVESVAIVAFAQRFPRAFLRWAKEAGQRYRLSGHFLGHAIFSLRATDPEAAERELSAIRSKRERDFAIQSIIRSMCAAGRLDEAWAFAAVNLEQASSFRGIVVDAAITAANAEEIIGRIAGLGMDNDNRRLLARALEKVASWNPRLALELAGRFGGVWGRAG